MFFQNLSTFIVQLFLKTLAWTSLRYLGILCYQNKISLKGIVHLYRSKYIRSNIACLWSLIIDDLTRMVPIYRTQTPMERLYEFIKQFMSISCIFHRRVGQMSSRIKTLNDVSVKRHLIGFFFSYLLCQQK